MQLPDDVSETELVILAQAQAAAHTCTGDGCTWCTIAGLVPEVLAAVPLECRPGNAE